MLCEILVCGRKMINRLLGNDAYCSFLFKDREGKSDVEEFHHY